MLPTLPRRFSSEEPYLSISQQSHSYSPPDLFGFSCTSTPASSCSHFPHHLSRENLQNVYPSPPHSDTALKATIPLPGLPQCDSTYGGILDSPVLRINGAFELPPSPPQTLPTATLALPPTDGPLCLTPDPSPRADTQMLSPSLSAHASLHTGQSLYPLLGVPSSSVSAADDTQLLSPLSELSDTRIPSPTQPEQALLWGEDDSNDLCLLPMRDGTIFHVPPSPSHRDHLFPDLEPIDQDMDWYLQSPTVSTHDLPFDDDIAMSSLPGPSDPSHEFSRLQEVFNGNNFADCTERSNFPSDAFSFDRSPTLGLLLIDEVPPPRSPSPENFDLNESVVNGCSDPDLQKLVELRRRSQAEERIARQDEYAMLERGDLFGRAEAKCERKKQKERAREISALLRLKLGDDIVASPKGEFEALEWKKKKSAKKAIKSIPQLVAKMVFRRRETRSVPLQPMGGRRPGRSPRSPLCRSTLMEEDGEDEDDRMELDADNDGLGLGLGLGEFDGDPWTTVRSHWDGD